MKVNDRNFQLNRIFDEIKEVGIRDSNRDEIQDNDNLLIFQPGFVSLLKNKFSYIGNEMPLQPHDGCLNEGKFRHKKSTIEINKEEIPCLNLVSDTRRVFEYISPKEIHIDDVEIDNSLNTISSLLNSNLISNDIDNLRPPVLEIKQNIRNKPAQLPVINSNGTQKRQRSKNNFILERKSFIFNASDFSRKKINDTSDSNVGMLNQNNLFGKMNHYKKPNVRLISDYHNTDKTNKNQLQPKSILKNSKNLKTTRNIRFASNNFLITVHIYEREDPTIEEYYEDIIHDTKTQSNRSDYSLIYPTTNLIETELSICRDKIIDEVMDFKPDMLF